MKYVRLKTGLHAEQMKDRLKYRPEIIELHLVEGQLHEPEVIVGAIRACKAKGARVYLHHPMTYNGQYLDIISTSEAMRNHYDWSCRVLAAICRQEDVKCVLHCHYRASESTNYRNPVKRKEMRSRIEEILRMCERTFLWEDTVRGIFSAENPFLLADIVQPLNLPLTIDISHSFIALNGDNMKLQQHLEKFHSYARYFHLVDSMGSVHDSLPLGHGRINWRIVKPYVKDKDFIFEIDLQASNYKDCTPMIESVRYFNRVEGGKGISVVK